MKGGAHTWVTGTLREGNAKGEPKKLLPPVDQDKLVNTYERGRGAGAASAHHPMHRASLSQPRKIAV